jgi:hypothetical protein
MKCDLRTWLMLNGPCCSLTAEHESQRDRLLEMIQQPVNRRF